MIASDFEDSVTVEHEIIYGSHQNFLYHVLGLPFDATDVEIKNAYRQRALQYHPDRHMGNIQHEKRKKYDIKFKEVNQAYHILSKPRYRQLYDEFNGNIDNGKTPSTSAFTTNAFGNAPKSLIRYIFAFIAFGETNSYLQQDVKHVVYVKLASLICTICLFAYFLLLTVGLVLVDLRLDLSAQVKLTSTPWTVIFIPFWILWSVAVMLSILIALRILKIKLQQRTKMPACQEQLEHKMLSSTGEDFFLQIISWSFLNVPVMTICLFLSHVLLALALDYDIVPRDKWKFLLSPYVLAECFCFLTSFSNNMDRSKVAKRLHCEPTDHKSRVCEFGWRVFVTSITFLIFFALRIFIAVTVLANVSNEEKSWYNLISPVAIYCLCQILSLSAQYPPKQGHTLLIFGFALYIFFFRFLPVVMVTVKLQMERFATISTTTAKVTNTSANLSSEFDLQNMTLVQLVERHYLPLYWCLSFIWLELGVILFSLLVSCFALVRLMREDCTYMSLEDAQHEELTYSIHDVDSD